LVGVDVTVGVWAGTGVFVGIGVFVGVLPGVGVFVGVPVTRTALPFTTRFFDHNELAVGTRTLVTTNTANSTSKRRSGDRSCRPTLLSALVNFCTNVTLSRPGRL
jgi:hypothetical protein